MTISGENFGANQDELDELDEFDEQDELDAWAEQEAARPQNGKSPMHPIDRAGWLFKQMFDRLPPSFAAMFDVSGNRLKMLTRTPKGAMSPIVWMDVINQGKDPSVDLLGGFLETFDLRMIAMEGRGRDELREIMIAERMVDGDEEGEEIRTPQGF